MSRGKNQASQNAKKLAVAEQRIVELERELSAAATSAHEREQELLNNIQILRNRLSSEVDSLAQAKVDEAVNQANKRVAEIERLREESAIQATRYLAENDVELTLKGWGEFAEILKVHPGKMITTAAPGQNRRARRANRSHLNWVAQQKSLENR